MVMTPIYLDHNATTPVAPEVTEALLPYLREHWGNPSSTHIWGTRAREGTSLARAQVAAMLGARPDDIVFTSGGTESNNHALRGVLERSSRRKLVISAIEHPAITQVATWLGRVHGVRVEMLPVTGDGIVDLDAARELIDDATALVSVMHSNNETGALQPIAALADLAHQRGALMHTDAAQSIGKVAVDVASLRVDLLSIAGHKFYAPKGIGALYVRPGTAIAPFMLGAGHESGRRAGTENIPYIVGLGEAARLVQEGLAQDIRQMAALRDRFEAELRDAFAGLHLNGPRKGRLPNTAHVSFVGLSGSDVLHATPRIAASTGSACKSEGTEPSGVLAAMGADAGRAAGAVRFSLGRRTTEADIDAALAALRESVRQLNKYTRKP